MKKIVILLLALGGAAFAGINMDITKQYWSKSQTVKATKAWINNKLVDIADNDYSHAIGIVKGQEVTYRIIDDEKTLYHNGMHFRFNEGFMEELSKERFLYKLVGGVEFAWIMYDKVLEKYYLEVDLGAFKGFVDSSPYLVLVDLDIYNTKEKLKEWLLTNVKADDDGMFQGFFAEYGKDKFLNDFFQSTVDEIFID